MCNGMPNTFPPTTTAFHSAPWTIIRPSKPSKPGVKLAPDLFAKNVYEHAGVDI